VVPERTEIDYRAVWRRGEEGALPLATELVALEESVATLNLEPGAVQLAVEIAALDETLDDHHRLLLVKLILASLAAHAEGSTRLDVKDRAVLPRLLAPLCAEAAESTATELRNWLATKSPSSVIARSVDEFAPLMLLDGFLYHQRIHAAESRLAERVLALLAATPARAEGAAIAPTLDDIRTQPVSLSDEQLAAVATAARSRLALISGGPGTGKTSIIVAILRALVRLGLEPRDIALAAPTGKAAYRMRESIRESLGEIENPGDHDTRLSRNAPEPQTVHRLLRWSPTLGRFRHHRQNPLAAKVVIVDESSMLDLVLMERLTGALAPQARLVLLGDADQLPSVAAGAVFRDLITAAESASAPPALADATCRLTKSFRMDPSKPSGRAILSVARAINEGAAKELFEVKDERGEPLIARRRSAEEIVWEKVEWLPDDEKTLAAFVDHWFSERVRGNGPIQSLVKDRWTIGPNGFIQDRNGQLPNLFRHFAESRILCVTRVFENGAEKMNNLLHQRASASRGAAHGASRGRFDYLPGEPVLFLHNDYDRMLFNGDQGLTLWGRERGKSKPSLIVAFERPGGYEAFYLETLRPNLELAYATTVHKAQGSEFRNVAVILPREEMPLLTAEVAYTAVTRAAEGVVVVGGENALERFAARVRRSSGMADKIRAR
jgi:exodeoxyribonuclease V alpha subunit